LSNDFFIKSTQGGSVIVGGDEDDRQGRPTESSRYPFKIG
jgi:hypothetical protein